MLNLAPSIVAAIDRLDKLIKADFQHRNSGTPNVNVAINQKRIYSAIYEIGGENGFYARNVRASPTTQDVVSVATALKMDLEDGYGTKINELAHAEVFGDLFDYADYLLAEGHKDAAAVIAGGAFESHLRRLAAKNNIPTTDANDKPVKPAKMNEELAKATVYDATTAKQVLAWQGLRNDAAHGDYDKYNAAKVAVFVMGLRVFIATYPV